MSTGIAVLAIGAAVVLCFESFAAADQDMERLNATSTQSPVAGSSDAPPR